MKRKNSLICKQCGSVWESPLEHCLKCNWDLRILNRSRTLEKDIAHNHQTVEEAMNLLRETIQQGKKEKYGQVRLIVGGGLIGMEAEKILSFLKHSKSIKSFARENYNSGALIVVMK